MNLILAFLSGLVAAFTPCVVILIPALMYAFSQKAKNTKERWMSVSYFIISFLLTYIIFAAFLKGLLSSSIKYGLQLGIGIIFVAMGILAMLNRFNPLNFPLLKHKWLFGTIFAILISVNPCTFAYLGVLLATAKTATIIPTMIIFALGLLTPALLFAIFGKKLLEKVNKAGKVTHRINQGMNILLIAMGAYMMFTIKSFNNYDMYMAGILLITTFIIILRSFYFLRGWKELKKISNLLLIISLIIISLAVLIHCNGNINHSNDKYISPFSKEGNNLNQEAQPSCSSNVTTCTVCRRCMNIFAGGAGLGFLAVILAEYYRRREAKKINKLEKNK